jgi:hypothetical protein
MSGYTQAGVHIRCPACGWASYRRKRWCECQTIPCTCHLGVGFGFCPCGAMMEPRVRELEARRVARAKAQLRAVGG